MFASLNTCGACSDGCASPGCTQQAIMTALVEGCSSCSDLANAVAYINANFDSISPLSLRWGSHPCGWQYAWESTFDSPSDTTPDGAHTETFNGLIGSGFEYQNISSAAVDGPGTGAATRTSFLIPGATAYLVGSWHDGGNGFIWQSACKMTGVAVGDCYRYDLPIPPLDLCASSETASSGRGGPDYNFFVNAGDDACDAFADFHWGAFATMCAANPTTCNPSISSTPADCLNPEPFFGDDPP